jgi:hypothetical protein
VATENVNVRPGGAGSFSMEPLQDERALQEDCQEVREQISRFERKWSQSASSGNGAGWKSAVQELHQRLDDLGQRIDRNLP